MLAHIPSRRYEKQQAGGMVDVTDRVEPRGLGSCPIPIYLSRQRVSADAALHATQGITLPELLSPLACFMYRPIRGLRARRGDREAEGAALEMPCTVTRTEGSNPSLSAYLEDPTKGLRHGDVALSVCLQTLPFHCSQAGFPGEAFRLCSLVTPRASRNPRLSIPVGQRRQTGVSDRPFLPHSKSGQETPDKQETGPDDIDATLRQRALRVGRPASGRP